MADPKPTVLSLPGKVTAVSLTLPIGLSDTEIIRTLRVIGSVHAASPWWAADALAYAEDRLPEGKFSQIAEELGWAPQTLSNALWVGRAIPAGRRRGFPLTFAHHAEVARLKPEEQDRWLDRAVKGDSGVTWSHRRLRSEIRGVKESLNERATCSRCGGTGYEP